MKYRIWLALIALIASLSNPIYAGNTTSNKANKPSGFHLISEESEIKIGETHFPYGQQNGNGQFLQDPALTAYVQSVGDRLAKYSKRPDLPYEFVILNSSIPNAWAMPGGKIAIHRGLLQELNNEAELAAVLGHEITHAAKRHSAKAMERQLLINAGLLAANIGLQVMEAKNPNVPADALMLGGQVAAAMVTTKYSRNAELEADAFGLDTMIRAGYDPDAAVSLQETFVRLQENKSENWLNGLFASHPPSKERAKANQQRAQKLKSPALTLGKENFDKKMAYLRSIKPAYDAYDEAQKAMKKRQYAKAMTLTTQAITLAPKEALFYGLKGDLLNRSNLLPDALRAYDKAIELDDSYYYYYRQRGKLYKRLGQYGKAKADLKRSQKLLPTTMTQHMLDDMKQSA